MPRTLVFADVHANLAALEAVVEAAGPFDRCIFLGDIVGFGPEPEACINLIRDLQPIAWIRGNHDLPPRRAHPGGDRIDTGRAWEHWTHAQLSPLSADLLRSLPDTLRLNLDGGRVRLIHYFDGVTLRITAPGDLAAIDNTLRAIEEPHVWFAHSHHAIHTRYGGRTLMNPGAVGQPRDGDPRASYAVVEDGEVTLHRAAYDVDRTVTALSRLPLTTALHERWVANYRQGIVGPGSAGAAATSKT